MPATSAIVGQTAAMPVTGQCCVPDIESAMLILPLFEALSGLSAPACASPRFEFALSDSLEALTPGSLLALAAPRLADECEDLWVVAGGESQLLELKLVGLRFLLVERGATAEHPRGCIDVFVDDGAVQRLQFRCCIGSGGRFSLRVPVTRVQMAVSTMATA